MSNVLKFLFVHCLTFLLNSGSFWIILISWGKLFKIRTALSEKFSWEILFRSFFSSLIPLSVASLVPSKNLLLVLQLRLVKILAVLFWITWTNKSKTWKFYSQPQHPFHESGQFLFFYISHHLTNYWPPMCPLRIFVAPSLCLKKETTTEALLRYLSISQKYWHLIHQFWSLTKTFV